jgi:Na+/H+ antiporter NhaD/arsenite permease-like protein
MDFVMHLTPVVVIMMAVLVVIIKLVFSSRLQTRPELRQRVLAMDEKAAITDLPLLKKSLFVLTLVLIGFVFHGPLHYEPATVALFGAGLLLLLSGTKEPHRVLAEIEWPTLFFFIGLFIIIGGTVKVGLIEWMSTQMLALTHGNLFGTSMLLLWFSAIASAIIDNIPYVATMNPLVIDMAGNLWPGESGVALLQHPDLMPLWWSLALGACLGGNGSPIGASANVIVVGMSERAGKRISFMRFVAYGLPIMVLTVFIAMIYIWLRYYLF